MIALLQRVSGAWVDIAGERVATIDRGLMVLLGVQRDDNEAIADRLLERLLGYRVFADADGKMNVGLVDTPYALLLVPQFTLAADTRRGRRPGFSTAAEPGVGRSLFDYVVERAVQRHGQVASGCFGADMQVGLVNDGPVTFWLQVPA